jgi:peptidoglycan/xylan/chitin deacetylase (PgdA/CDA1 family)
MNSEITIVMYHYVRDLRNSRYPEIKGLDVSLFKEQISYFKKNYNIITMEALIEAINKKTTLPHKSLLLTFDDGYIDHYTCVFPVLVENGIQGSFFIPAKTVLDHKLLDVNKIHFILASCLDKGLIIADILNALEKNRINYELESNEYYLNKSFISNRYDSKEVVFIKRMLQVELNESLRKKIVDELFIKYVSASETIFAKELYLSIDQIKTMLKFGMHIGAHGYDHYWLGSLTMEKQKIEIFKSLEFLLSLGIKKEYWTMCYPYGSFNQDTIDILNNFNCKAAFTTEVRIANIILENKLTLPRLDTNDFPSDVNSPYCHT